MQISKPYIWLNTPGTSNELKILVQCPTSRSLDLNATQVLNTSGRKLTLKFALVTNTPVGQLTDFSYDLDSVQGFAASLIDLVIVQILVGTTVVGSASAITTAGSNYFD
jgi:hypothetical protein